MKTDTFNIQYICESVCECIRVVGKKLESENQFGFIEPN